MADQDLQQLRAEAEAHRQAIVRDAELVTDRVAPGRIAERQKARFSRRVGAARRSVFGTPDRDRNPGWTDDDRGSPDDQSLRDRASETLDRVNESTPDSVAEFTEGNPLAAGLIGLGVGLLAATLIPETPEEQRVADRAQHSIDSAARQVGEAGQRVAEKVKPAAEQAAAEVKGSAQQSAESVKSDAQEHAQDMKDTAQSKADHIR